MRIWRSSPRWAVAGRTVRRAALAVAVTGLLLGTAGSAAAASYPKPVLDSSMPDPGVTLYKGTFYAFGTDGGLRESWASTASGPWSAPANRLAPHGMMPGWIAAGKGIWAPDMVVLRGKFVVYFSAALSGVPAGAPTGNDAKPAGGARCIGAAVASSPTGPFTVSARPLVCLKGRGAADDMTTHPGDRIRGEGVIDADPAVLSGTPYLLYKTQSPTGARATIRMVRLSANGLSTAGASRQLVRSVVRTGTFADTIEGPSLVQHGSWLILFAAHGNFGNCGYSTIWYASKSLWSWSNTPGGTLLSASSTHGLCGPGGADVSGSKVAGQYRLFFHGWVRAGTTVPSLTHGIRVLYAAVLTFGKNGHTPRVSFLG